MTNLFLHFTPVLAVVLADVGGIPSGLSVYGPIGLVCILLAYREERTRVEMKEERTTIREDNSKLRDEIRNVAHQMKGLNRNLIYYTATHATGSLREVAEKELERMNATQQPL